MSSIPSTESIKPVRLTFTRRQYNDFRDASAVLEMAIANEAVEREIARVLGLQKHEDVRKILKHVFEAPGRIFVGKGSKKERTSDGTFSPVRNNYFTKQIESNEKVRKLFEATGMDTQDTKLHYDQVTITSNSDVRAMIWKYISLNNLSDSQGVMVDDFLASIVPLTMDALKDSSHYSLVNDMAMISKADRHAVSRWIHSAAKEILM